jgi:murein L,D-transpeptidase YcbB/YkuD
MMNQMQYKFCFLYLLLPALIFFAACGRNPQKTQTIVTDTLPPKDRSVKGSFSDQQILRTDSIQINSFFKKFPDLKNYASDVRQFYGYRDFRFAWYDASGLVEQAENLYNHLSNLEREGVQTPAPYIRTLDSMINDPLIIEKPDTSLEILLTAEYLFYADKVWNGISESQTTKLQWYLPRKKLNLPYLTDSLIKDTAALLFSDNYSNRQYNLLKKELIKYRRLDSASSWNPIVSKTPSFKLDDSSVEIGKLRERLFLLDDLKENSGSGRFDESLENAVKSFQTRYGLTADGVVGAGFLRYINQPLQDMIRKIIVNMERMRWIPLNLTDHFLLINIPSFSLYAYDHDTVTFRMNVVVGKEVHKTVLFSGDIRYIVFSPYWNVPASIMKKEILPALRRNPDYLKRNDMEWNGKSIRQKPGPKNSLGLVKFLFPNSYNIYLHDSPAKSLFGESSRAFSHGCIRLAEPEKLAVYLLQDYPQWSKEKINQAMHAGVEKYVTLKKPVPVYIGYLTAWVDNQGRIQFRDDIYKRDGALEKMLFQ